METEPNIQVTKSNKSRPLTKIYIVLAILLLAAAAYLSYRYILKSKSLISSEIAGQINFTIYLPKSLPLSYKIDKQSFRYESGILRLYLLAHQSKPP